MFKSLKFFHKQWANNVSVKINFTVTKFYCELLVTKWSCTQLTVSTIVIGKTQNFLQELTQRVTSPSQLHPVLYIYIIVRHLLVNNKLYFQGYL